MVIVVGPAIALIVGLLMYVLCANPKLQEIGRILFFCGAFWLCARVGGVVSLSSREVHVPAVAAFAR